MRSSRDGFKEGYVVKVERSTVSFIYASVLEPDDDSI